MAALSQPSGVALLVLSVLLNAGASLLLKSGAGAEDTRRLLLLAAALACYGLGFLSYFLCLRVFPVGVAYPVITGGAILVIVAAATLVLGEPMTASKALGAALVVAGGLLLLRG
ncbi:MAG TPA: SMR family transporter [Azospirillaceae bacterium]|nr:SMR family transporter [Azospirillaceae bacterium]